MRVVVPVAFILCVSAQVLSRAQAPSTDASTVLAAAREALGGEQKLAAVKNFVARGRTRQVRGDNLVPIEFEIACELPDRYVRRDEIPAQESGPTSSGFNGDSLIQLPPPEPLPQAAAPGGAARNVPPAGAALPAGSPPAPPDPRAARVALIKQDLARLTLGMFATSFASCPLVFSRAGQAEAPQGAADIVDVKGPGTFALKLFINSQTHLPIMVSWTTPAANVVLGAPGPTATKDEQELRKKALAAAKPVEHRIYYSDYREVGNGLKFPFRLRRAIGGETVEETNFDDFKVNTRIDPRRFEPLK